MKILNKKILKITFILIILLTLYVFINAYLYTKYVSQNLSNSVLRLHVIANSDSEQDQNLKYIVRDNLIYYMNTLCSDSSSKEEAITVVSNHIDDFTKIANSTIAENGFSYTADVELGNFEFPTKSYGDISFPAGFYDALEVKLGKANRKKLVVCTIPFTLLYRYKFWRCS